MPSGQGAGTNPIHNKQKKKAPKQDDDPDDDDFKKNKAAAKKAEEEMKKALAGKKGPLNTGSQGIKKSGKK